LKPLPEQFAKTVTTPEDTESINSENTGMNKILTARTTQG